MISQPKRPFALCETPLAVSPPAGHCGPVSTPAPPSPPEFEDLRGLARGLRLLVEIGARALTEDAGPSELARRVTSHLGCELGAVVQVTERFRPGKTSTSSGGSMRTWRTGTATRTGSARAAWANVRTRTCCR